MLWAHLRTWSCAARSSAGLRDESSLRSRPTSANTLLGRHSSLARADCRVIAAFGGWRSARLLALTVCSAGAFLWPIPRPSEASRSTPSARACVAYGSGAGHAQQRITAKPRRPSTGRPEAVMGSPRRNQERARSMPAGGVDDWLFRCALGLCGRACSGSARGARRVSTRERCRRDPRFALPSFEVRAPCAG
jgi:hypothetical protein